MVYVVSMGRLGNLMFEYATALALHLDNNDTGKILFTDKTITCTPTENEKRLQRTVLRDVTFVSQIHNQGNFHYKWNKEEYKKIPYRN